jgi:hypothetical protein
MVNKTKIIKEFVEVPVNKEVKSDCGDLNRQTDVLTVTNAPIIKGVVETLVHEKILTGWVYLKQQSEVFSDELVINIYNAQDFKLLGEGACNIHRSDLTLVKANNKFGFHVALKDKLTVGELPSIIITVSSTKSSILHNLSFTAGLRKKIAKAEFQNNVKALCDDAVAKNDTFVMSTLKQLIDYDWNVDNEINQSKDETTEVSIPVGNISRGKIAVSGRCGHFFLYSGINNLDKLYARRGSTIYKQWIEVLQARQQKASEQDFKFLQLIIPEKQSLLPWLYPSDIQVPTENLQLLEEELKEKNIAYVLSGSNFYSTFEDKETIFKKTDTHFTTNGARLTVSGMLSQLNVSSALATTEFKEKLISGDLGNKYIGGNFTESVLLLASHYEPTLIKQYNPPQGTHVGIMRAWENENAPNKQKVLVFGNSFFERGTGSTGLSWWFSRLFSEFQFYWSNSCDWSIVEKVQPDILICQTNERFLTRIPKN